MLKGDQEDCSDFESFWDSSAVGDLKNRTKKQKNMFESPFYPC